MNRSYFPVTVTGGTAYSANTPPIDGEIRQIRWHHATDTGQVATIEIAVLPDANDTGIGWQIYNRASANVATPFVAHPVQPTHNAAGAGVDTGEMPIALANDRLGVRVTPADTGVVINGKLYIWHG